MRCAHSDDGKKLSLLMYPGFCGISCSRKIAAATCDMIPFRVLTGDQHPPFTVISEVPLPESRH
jgi:hypothetical protein